MPLRRQDIEDQLARILRSEAFAGSENVRAARAAPVAAKLLKFLVEEALAGRTPTEYEIGRSLWARPHDWIPGEDRIVSVTLAQVRKRLQRYYSSEGIDDPIHFRFPKGHGFEPIIELKRNTPADKMYQRGMYSLTHSIAPKHLMNAIGFFKKAIAADPQYASAYAAQTDALCQLSWYIYHKPPKVLLKEADANANRAFELAPQSWYANVAVGIVAHRRYQWDIAAKAFEAALVINESATTQYLWFYNYLDVQGRLSEAAQYTKEAANNDPANTAVQLDHAASLYFMRHFEEAADLIHEVIDMGDESRFRAHGMLALVYIALGRYKAALKHARILHDIAESDISSGLITLCLANTDNEEEAHERLEQLERQASSRYVSKMTLCHAYMAVGDTEKAIDALELAYEEFDPWMMYLHFLPIVDPLRSHPRFQALLKRLKLSFD